MGWLYRGIYWFYGYELLITFNPVPKRVTINSSGLSDELHPKPRDDGLVGYFVSIRGDNR